MKFKKIILSILSIFAITGFAACNEVIDDPETETPQPTIPEVSKYSVTINLNNGEEAIVNEYEAGQEFVLPTNPTKENADFLGWYLDENCTEEVSSKVVTKNINVYAKWREYITIAEALDMCSENGFLATERYYIKAVIEDIENPTYGSMNIKDSTGSIYVYGSYSADGEKRYSELEEKPYAGYTVILSALLQNYNGTKEIKSAWIIDFYKVQEDIDLSEYQESTILAAREAEKGAKVKLTGVVAKITYASGMVPSGFYLIDGTNSIYVYDSQIAPQVSVGNKVVIAAEKDYWILDTEVNNASKFGYKGCCQVTKAILVSNDKKTDNSFDLSWVSESTVYDIMNLSIAGNYTTTIFKVNALVKKAPGAGFINYYIDDLDGVTGSYVYTQCNGNDLDYLEEYDGKICTVYLSIINAKSSASGCVYRFMPIFVKDEGYTFDLNNTPSFIIKYYGKTQFKESYMTDPKLELIQSVSSELLGFENASLSYSSSNEEVASIVETEAGIYFHTGKAGTATITITGTYNGNSISDSYTIVVEATPDNIEYVGVKEAVEATIESEVVVKGIVGPSLVNKSGFYLIDDNAIISVLLSADELAKVSIGDEVVLKGVRQIHGSDASKDIFGESTINNCTVEAIFSSGNDYSTKSFDTTKTLEDLYNLDESVDYTTIGFVVTVTVEVIETNYYTNINLVSGDVKFGLYCSSANQYNWLKAFVGQEITVEIAVCNWNKKGYYRGCVLAVIKEDGTKVINTLNFN